MCNGRFPRMSGTILSAPLVRRSLTQSVWPNAAATKRGVCPRESCMCLHGHSGSCSSNRVNDSVCMHNKAPGHSRFLRLIRHQIPMPSQTPGSRELPKQHSAPLGVPPARNFCIHGSIARSWKKSGTQACRTSAAKCRAFFLSSKVVFFATSGCSEIRSIAVASWPSRTD